MKKQQMKKPAEKRHFSLRLRLTLIVSLELVIVVVLAYLLERLIPQSILTRWDDAPLISLLAVSLLFGSVLTWFLSKMFFDPIKKVSKAMEKVADGDFSVQLSTRSTSSEIQEIYSGFNLMAHELRNMEILQTDFVSNASHEFKTPVNAIEGYSTLLQNSEHLDPLQQEYVEKIIYNTKRLSNLTGSILLLSKIENHSITTGKSRFRLDEQIRQSILGQEAEWEKKEIEFEVDLHDVTYYGNEKLMYHVWDNLISNAIKFNPKGGIIKIELVKQQKKIICTVADSGPGVSEDEKKRIFDKFYQADSSHKEIGHGLGLALVKRILILEGGSVTVENQAAGGCCFTVTLTEK